MTPRDGWIAAGDFVLPDFLAGVGIERQDAFPSRDIHYAVYDDGCDLGIAANAPAAARSISLFFRAKLIGPGRLQLGDVACGDLVERRKSSARGVAAVARPVARGWRLREHRYREKK